MRITTKGQITVPKSLRERFGITRRTEVEFQEQRGKLVLVKKDTPGTLAKIRGRVKRLPFGDDVDQYIDAVRGKGTR